MKQILKYIWIPTTCFCLVSCSSMKTADPEEKDITVTETKPESSIELGNEIIRIIARQDYQAFSKLLAGRLGFDITRKDFEASQKSIQEKYGNIVNWSHLTQLKDPIADQLVWKVHFSKKLQDGTTVERDMLFRLAYADIQGKITVMALGFF